LATSTEAPDVGTGGGAATGPGRAPIFVYCDYWASVLGLRGIVRAALLRHGLIDLSRFRTSLDRPETRLPGMRYYLLTLLAGPVLIPYRLLLHARSKLHLKVTAEDEAAAALASCALRLAPRAHGHVDLQRDGETLATDLFDPRRAEVVFSLVYPTYKVLFAAFVAIALALISQAALHEGVPSRLENWVRFAHYPLVVAFSWLLFRDTLTAFAAPLPVYVVVAALGLSGTLREPRPEAFAVALIALAVAYFIVDGFLVPRALPPALYYYSADPADPSHPYEPGQAPTWLAGRAYWVWRFSYATAAELNKVWERDWERVEVWVRADGPQAGDVEWIVVDFHYRELWLPKRKLVSQVRAARLDATLERVRAGTARAAWMVEVDMNVVFHSPQIRSLHWMPLDGGFRRARLRQLVASLRDETSHDHAADYRAAVRHMQRLGNDFVSDIPEHFRGYALRQLLTTPWRFWRYPRGANTAVRPYVYSRPEAEPTPLANEPAFQFKAPPVSPAAADLTSRASAGA
jgi:hypothetical protein